MGVLSVSELYNRNGNVNEKYERTYQRAFQVRMTDPYDGAQTALLAVGISVGDFYVTSTESDASAVCLGLSTTCNSEDGKLWTVTADYGKWNPDTKENPLDEPYEVSWGFAQFERPVDEDVNGKPIVNTAGDPFLEALQRDDSRPILTITRNEASFNAGLAWQYRDVVNSAPFQGAPAGTVKVSNISSTRQFDQDFGFYWKTTYEFAFNPEGWKKRILNVGMRELDGGKRKNILVQNVPINDPAPLDNQGKVLPVGSPPIVLTFQVYPEADFSVFGF